MVERFQQFSKLESQRHLREYMEGSKLWKTVGNALLQYDVLLKRENVRSIMCDDFYEGAFIPENNKIIICANTTMNKKDFDNAISR